MEYQGEIICINGKYMINGIKKIVKYDPIIHTLLPNDIVKYSINPSTDKIKIIKLISRQPQTYLGIYLSSQIYFPQLPKIYNFILNTNTYEPYQTLIVRIDLSGANILSKYEPLQKTRINDWRIALDLYKPQNIKLKPEYIDFNTNSNAIEYIDLTHLDTFNVDPTESKDFDDAISIDVSNSKIYVHIVDAHSQIEPGSLIDINAFKNSFTLYLQEHIENILPKELAENDFSLIKDVCRKTVTIEFDINSETFEIKSHKIYKGIIKISNRYDYDQYDKILNEQSPQIDFIKGFINVHSKKFTSLETPSIYLNINKITGNMNGFECKNSNTLSHHMISTLMILVNLTISTSGVLTNQEIPQRYHSKHYSMNLEEFTGDKQIDSILSIKKFRKAFYSSTESGHHGLNLVTYTHFTSPIRRYFDVIVHRLLAGVQYNNLNEILCYINSREIYIDTIIKLYLKIKILSYFESSLDKIWNGYIISVNSIYNIIILQDILFEIEYKSLNKLKLYSQVKIKIESIDWLELKPNIILL
jgi:exoribonuclease R